MFEWWSELGSERRGWFLLSGFLTLLVVGLAVGIVALNVVPFVEPLVHLGFATALAGLFGGFVTFLVRLG